MRLSIAQSLFVLGIHYGDLKRYNFSLISFLFKFWQTLIHFVDPKRDNIFLMSFVFKFWEFDVISVLESKSSVVWAYMVSKEKLPLLAVCPGERNLGFCSTARRRTQHNPSSCNLKRYNFSLICFLFKFWQTLIRFVDPKRDNIFLMSSVFVIKICFIDLDKPR